MSTEVFSPDSDDANRPVARPDDVALARRRVLLSAASLPLIATIPSGAALAASSFLSCAVKNKLVSDNSTIVVQQTTPGAPPGNPVWVRLKVDRRRFQKGTTVRDGYLINGVWYQAPTGGAVVGSPFDPQPDLSGSCVNDGTNWCPFFPPANQPALTAYVLESYHLDNDTNPTALIPVGPWPKTNTDGNEGPAGNFALAASCLCSVNPGLDPNSPSLYCQ